ncbi:MAG: hypothetical protein K2M10_03575, partial [Muribaculaceae bacterium]|nr:hypothetical protein [Muribaculaceae bacterium]
MQTDRKIIDVDDEIRQDDRPEEIPVITIEESSSPSPRKDDGRIIFRETSRVRNRIKAFTIILGCILLAGIFFWAYRYYSMLTEVESSVSDAENIAILTSDGKPDYAVGSVASADSVLGVAFDMYSLSGLKASLEREMPDTADRSLVLFMRSADYHPDGSVLGEMVIDGTPALSKSGKRRQGYVAISKDGVPVVGISLSDRLTDFAKDNNGSLFRQYVL